MSNKTDEKDLQIIQLRREFKIKAELLNQVIRQVENDRRKITELEGFRDELAHLLVHDIRNPLACVNSALELLTLLQENLSADQKKCVEDAKSCAKRINNLVSDILDARKIEENKFKLHKTSFAVSELAGLLSPYFDAAQKEGKNIAADIEKNLIITADKNLIQRVLENLIGNSLKYTSSGGRITLKAKKEGRQVLFEVANSGEAIAEEILPRLFEKFSSRGGTGLGLFFCRLAVEAHGGKIWAESQPDKGSRFYFYLPGSGTK